MPNIDLLKSIKFETSEKLVTIFGNDAAIYNTGTLVWDGQHINLVPSTFEMAYCKGYGYLCSPGNSPRVLNSSGVWSTTTNLLNAPTYAKYPFGFEDKLFMANCTVNGISYPRRVFYTDIIEKDDGVVWGLEYGTDLIQTAGSKEITSASASFILSGIKIGDPFIISAGANAGVYAVEEVVSTTSIILDKALPYTYYGSSYIVGSNWFDISSDIKGVGEYYGVMLIFEDYRAWRWSRSIGKKEIFGVKGTPTHRSIVSNHRGYTFWYHPSDGIIQFNGSVGKTVSEKIQPIISAITDPTAVVGWPGVGLYKDHVYFYIGNVTFSVNGESFSLTRAIIDYNIIRNKWKVFEYNAVIKCATVRINGSTEEVYLGTDGGLVLKFNTGNTDYDVTTNNGTATLPIHSYMITHPIYPTGIEAENNFEKYYSWKDKGTGIKSRYKLHGCVNKNDAEWSSLQELNSNYDECKIDPQKSQARGMSFMIDYIGSDAGYEFLGFSFIYWLIGEAFEDEL